MSIYINSKIKQGAWGGGNQFLKALRIGLKGRGKYSEVVETAEAVIFNHYQDLAALIVSFFLNNKIKRVHRLGPIMSLHRPGIKWKIVDYVVALFANLFADLVIFQSKWSYKQSLKFGFNKNKKYKIIHNSVNDSIFFRKEKNERNLTEPIKLIYTSWSANKNKGFDFLSFLDENLDFNKFQMKFIGNSPISFKNIKIISALSSNDLAEELRSSDIFVSPTKDDACSNAILEALSCGLPVVALNSGANIELIKNGGEVFSSEEDMLKYIKLVAENLPKYQEQIEVKNILEVTKEYIEAIKEI